MAMTGLVLGYAGVLVPLLLLIGLVALLAR
jgi:hypothetical protein